MSLITLISDWKNNDFYTGAIKGSILSLSPQVQLVDISHNINTFDIAQAAYILRNTYFHFPEETIHIICVENRPFRNRYIAIKVCGHYFLSADTGIFGLIFDADVAFKSYEIDIPDKDLYPTFPELSVLAPAACHLANKGQISELGPQIGDTNRQVPLMAVYEEDIINGRIIYIDSYGNAITNITKELFRKIRKDRSFRITVKNRHNVVTSISKSYYDVGVGDLLVIFNSDEQLEIALVNFNAAVTLSLDTDTYVRVQFFDE